MSEKAKAKAERLYRWHLWFAWFPISTVDGKQVWLRSVWRRSWRTMAGWHSVYLDLRAFPLATATPPLTTEEAETK